MKFCLHTREKTRYCEGWKTNATTFQKQGCYAWMAEQLQPYAPVRVLDVGCGTGEGLAALLATSTRSIVTIEENFDCMKAAERYLVELGYSVRTIPRIGYVEHSGGRHELVIDQDAIIEEGPPITLVHADLLLTDVDTPLHTFLYSIPNFDAVTIWLMGTFKWRETCKTLDRLRIGSPMEYRLHTQNRTYEIADGILKPGGVLHVVDRGKVPDTDEIKNMIIDVHRDHASATSLCVSDFSYRVYTEPIAHGVRMIRDPATENAGSAMHSIILRKPE